jgi:outer membrane protein assembly factor BamD
LLRRNSKLFTALFLASLLGGCFGKKEKAPVAGTSAQPDKVLYDRATADIKRGRYSVGRLDLQTLINTYPDSEYLAKAKLEIGDSYYKEGGMAGLKQSIVEYKDFITFFPFLDEAAYAQMQVGMAHYRQMEKPDRDRAEAVQAEAELQTFLEKYPNNPLVPTVEQRLRDTQEVLAEGNFRVASFYYLRGAYKAAGARLLELTTRYPLYSQADDANWMLGQIYEKTEHNDIAAKYYARIVKDYPLSSRVGDAKTKLTKFGVPVPQPDPAAVARMQKDQELANRPGMIKRSIAGLRSAPDISTASRAGAPTMTPASESGDETLSFEPQAPVGVTGLGSNAAVETVTPGSSGSTPAPSTEPGKDDSTAAPSTPDGNATTTGASGSSDSSATQPATSTTPAAPANTTQESTSKKKKGIHKVLPF